jgi:CDP-diacylglycerol---glycerol-3-phosphate 3-phosphatidyltransferase
VDRLSILAPALLGITLLLVLFAVYTALYVMGRIPKTPDGKTSQTLGPFLTGSLMWLIRPIEHMFVVRGVSPNAITFASLVMCVASGALIGMGYLATGAWMYAAAGITDILDGRIARATGKQTRAGALFDSVSDRWGELAMFAG